MTELALLRTGLLGSRAKEGMNPRRLARCLPLAWVGLVACGSSRFVAEEPWSKAPAIRIAVLQSQGATTVRSLGPNEPFEVPLEDAFAGGGNATVWILGYSVEQLVAYNPALQGRSGEEMAALLTPALVDTAVAEAPRAAEMWCATIRQDGLHTVAYRACPWEEWKQTGLRIGWTLPASVACGGAKQSFDLPPGLQVEGMVATDPGQVVLLTGPATQDQPLTLLKLSDGKLSEPVPLQFYAPLPDVLSWDPQRRRIWGVGTATVGGPTRPFAVTEAGAELPLPPLNRGWSAVSAGDDGTVLGAAYDLFELSGDTWTLLEDRTTEQRPVRLLRVLRRDRVFFFTSCWVHEYSVDAGQRPDGLLFFDQACVERMRGVPAEPITLVALAADDELLVGAFSHGRIATVTKESSDSMAVKPGLRTAALLGGKRFLVAGEAGMLTYRNGQDWCPLSLGPTVVLERAVSAGDNATAYVAGMDASAGHAVLVQISVPPSLP